MKLLPRTLGIVGAEAAKFTPETEERARKAIRLYLRKDSWVQVVSGRCPLGGIDIWAIQEARKFGIPTREFPPARPSWSGGYKLRNIAIAEHSDTLLNIVVAHYPPTYRGMRFPLCYHCKTTDHVKSGGCWTMHYAKKLGKCGELWIIK